jgi:outer membrane lipoprotein SlyB
MTRILTLGSLAAAVALTAACSSAPRNEAVTVAPVTPSPSQYDAVRYGQVRAINIVERPAHTSGAGAVIGAVVGGVIGNQVGGGLGNVAATGAGAVAGGVVGNRIEQSRRKDNEVYRVDVQFDGGNVQTFDFADLNGLRVGDRVRYENNQLVRY